MARHIGPRTVQCYHCRHRFEVGGRAQSTSCPNCNKAVKVHDEVIDKLRAGLIELRTCGKLVVKKKGRLMVTKLIEIHGGIECEGIIDCGSGKVISGGPVTLGKKSQFKGELQAPSLTVAEGARIQSKMVAVPDDPLDLEDLPPPSNG